ncbi:hypothetical protein [Mesorhizobium sp. M0965]|uniref:hypothetical protein n=1 Tax=unclassified Mesorhizobium TaxID=325217 RepID=UPI0033371FFB
MLAPVHTGIAWLRDIHHICLVCWDFGRHNAILPPARLFDSADVIMLQAAWLLPGAGENLLHLSGSSASIRQHQPRSCGLVLLGYSPKPCGSREPSGQLPSSLINNAHVVVIDHAPELARAASQVPCIVERRTMSVHCSFDFVVGDEEIADTPFASRCVYILHPFN